MLLQVEFAAIGFLEKILAAPRPGQPAGTRIVLLA